MSLTVSAAGSAAATNGLLLRVLVLDNATLGPNPNTASGNSTSTSTRANVSLTPIATGSKAYSATISYNAGVSGPFTGNTQIDHWSDTVATFPTLHGVWVSTSTLTAQTPFTAGSNDNGTISAMTGIEVLQYGGTIATNGSSPAVVQSTTTSATTAAFAPPPGGKLILAFTSCRGGVGQAVEAVTDSFGLTWTEAVKSNSEGTFYAGIWFAYTPASLAFTAATPLAGVVGTAYSYSFGASGGYGGYTYAVTAGSLPTGLTLSAPGVLSGTPTVAGLSSFTVTATDSFGNTVSSGSLSMVVNKGTTPGGVVRQTWTGAAPAYFYGTLEIPVATTDYDWVWVVASWQTTEDTGIAYCSDSAHNEYQPCAFTTSGTARTQVFCVPNNRAASTVYVSTSAYVRWLTVAVLDVTGLQPGFTIDASNTFTGGPGTTLAMSLSTVQPDFVLAAGAFTGTPGTITPSGSGATWTTAAWGGINGSPSDGITQAVSWAKTSGAASPAMTYTAASGRFSGCMVAVYANGGLPVNANSAWPVIKCEAAFGYIPHKPTVLPTWTDLTSRFLGISGQRGRSFELDEIAAADVTVTLDNFDGALSPQNSASPYYPNVTLITPIRVTATWQGRTHTLFRGIMHALPQTFDFQRGMVKVLASDDWSKLAQALLSQAMIQEMLYDEPLDLWPLNEQQGASTASNWSGRSVVSLTPVKGSFGGGAAGPPVVPSVRFFGILFPVQDLPAAVLASLGVAAPGTSSNNNSAANSLTTGFGQQNTGTAPTGLAGTQDNVWGNFSTIFDTVHYQGSNLVDSNDNTLPLTSTGATYSVWAQMLNTPVNPLSGAVIMTLTDQNGTAGGKEYLALSYDGTNVTAAQTAGSHTFSPPSFLYDGQWHLWTATITTGGTISVYLDAKLLGSFAGSFPVGTPTMLQWGGDTTISPTSSAGLFTGCMYLAAAYDRVVDTERILSWYQSGNSGFLDELGGTRVQRILAWARWSAPQAIDTGLAMQQAFNYLGGGYASNGLSGSIGNALTAGGASGVASGAQADVTIQDIARTENAALFMGAGGTLTLRERDNANPSTGIALGDMDYALNSWDAFEEGLGPWTSVSSCTVARSSGWSYAGDHSALVTVTGSPVTAFAWGDKANVVPAQVTGFSCWVMSPQGCSVQASADFYTSGNAFISTVSSSTVVCPPMTPVFLNLTGITAPGTAAFAYPHPTLVSSPATGTQLYFDRPRLSQAGFQCPYNPDLEVTEDVQYLYNDIVITRNVDQAGYRARDVTSRARYLPRVYTRTIYSSADDDQAVSDCANDLLSDFAFPALRVSRVVVDAAENPQAWPFVLSADIGDDLSFTRSPVGGAAITGSFTILSVEPDIGQDKAKFTYVLAPPGVF